MDFRIGLKQTGCFLDLATAKLTVLSVHSYFAVLLTHLVNGWPQARIDALVPQC